MKKRAWEYMMLEPRDTTELPTGIVDYAVYKDEHGVCRYWGFVVYDRPLSGDEIDHFNLDGPLPCWV